MLSYDAQGRVIQRDIGDKSERFSYDKLGRIKSHQTPLGNFSFNYLGQTNQETQQRMGLGGLISDKVVRATAKAWHCRGSRYWKGGKSR